MMTYKAYIIEDSPEDVDLLTYYLKKYCLDIETVGSGDTVTKAIREINTLKPDIIFSDINLRQDTAFSVFEKIDPYDFQIILLSAHQEYALESYKYEVLDYLTKPYNLEGLMVAIDRLRKQSPSEVIVPKVQKKLNFIAIPSSKKVDFIKIEDILYCEADGRYTTFYLDLTETKKITTSKNIGEYEKSLLHYSFFRTHHKYLVNMNKVNTIYKDSGYYCEMKNRNKVPIAVRKYDKLFRYLNLK